MALLDSEFKQILVEFKYSTRTLKLSQVDRFAKGPALCWHMITDDN